MTMRVTMRDPRRSEDGLSVLLTGQTYTVSDAYGASLVSLGAIDTDGVLARGADALTKTETAAVRSLVSKGGKSTRRAQHQRELSTSATSSQAPAWAATTVTQVSDVVRLPTGELLICSASSTPFQTGGTAPTITAGAAPAAIADGNVTWWQLGELTRIAPAGLPAVAVTESGSAGNSAIGTLVGLFDSAASFDRLSAVNAENPETLGSFKNQREWAFIDGSSVDRGFGANGRRGQYATDEFVTQSDLIHIGYYATAGTTFLGERVRIWVEGIGTTEAPIIPSATGAARWWILAIPGGRRKRRIRIARRGDLRLRYVGVPTDCTVERPSLPSLLMGWFSDSFGDTESPNINSAHYDMAVAVSHRLGFPAVMHGTVGGTSYSLVNALSGNALGLQALLAANDFSGYAFDAILCAHGYNAGQAVGGATVAAETSAAIASWRQLRVLAQFAPVLAVGPWWVKTGGDIATMTAMGAALKTQFLAWADLTSAYIDPLDGSITRGDGTAIRAATGAWINTTNAAWVIGVDGAHPTPVSRAYLTDCLAQAGEAALAVLMV